MCWGSRSWLTSFVIGDGHQQHNVVLLFKEAAFLQLPHHIRTRMRQVRSALTHWHCLCVWSNPSFTSLSDHVQSSHLEHHPTNTDNSCVWSKSLVMSEFLQNSLVNSRTVRTSWRGVVKLSLPRAATHSTTRVISAHCYQVQCSMFQSLFAWCWGLLCFVYQCQQLCPMWTVAGNWATLSGHQAKQRNFLLTSHSLALRDPQQPNIGNFSATAQNPG